MKRTADAEAKKEEKEDEEEREEREEMQPSRILKIRGYVRCLVYSPKGDTLASSHLVGVCLWDLATLKKTYRHTGLGTWIRAMAFSEDGEKLGIISSEGSLQIRKVADWTLLNINNLSPTNDPITRAIFSADLTQVTATVLNSHYFRIHDTQTNEVTFAGGVGSPVCALAVCGKLIAALSSDDVISIFEYVRNIPFTTRDLVPIVKIDMNVSLPIINPASHRKELDFSPDGTRIAYNYSNIVAIWCTRTGAKIGKSLWHQHPPCAVKFVPGGEFIITASEHARLLVWDLHMGTPTKFFGIHRRVTLKSMNYIACSPDGKTFVTSCDKDDIKEWSISSDLTEAQNFALFGDIKSAAKTS